MLRLEKLVKIYKTGDQALKAVDLQVPEGQVLALIGPSGAGKSTLIRCINRLVEPTSGNVYLGDVELTGLSSGNLRRERRRMGMIFQEYALVTPKRYGKCSVRPLGLCRILAQLFATFPTIRCG